MALLRLAVPPHADNAMAADDLRTSVGQNQPLIEWSAVRPDSLKDEPAVKGYTMFTCRSPEAQCSTPANRAESMLLNLWRS